MNYKGMKISEIKHSIAFILILLAIHSHALNQCADSLVLNAMRDELKRNIDQLSAESFEKPFFIAYSIADVNSTLVNATLGAIHGSETRNYKDWQVRVMVGDYEINDESKRRFRDK